MNIGYKAFATLLLSRPTAGGVEERLTESQFGFRSGHSTQDAIFVLRRRIEAAHEQRSGRLSVLALDWKMAFDSVDPAAMIACLRRFGLPEHILDVIWNIYAERHFKIQDCDNTSTMRPQAAGISQGCPLSPLLFVMCMTIVMKDAAESLSNADQTLLQNHELAALLYADDTLLLGRDAAGVQRYLDAVERAGSNLGLQLHADKFQLIQIGTSSSIRNSAGAVIQARDSMVYLGALISANGRMHAELARKLGAAHADFRALSKVWRHSSLSRRKKVQILNVVILTKLTYGIATAWLNTAERRRLDGFHCRCLRQIWGIKPPFISRVANKTVLENTDQRALTEMLERQQVIIFQRVAAAPSGSLLRDSTFCRESLRPYTDYFVRKIGRPRLEWVAEVRKLGVIDAETS